MHNLEKLIELCARHDSAFANLKSLGQQLTPYAVELRYDDDFWPAPADAQEAFDAARSICDFVLTRLPPDVRPPNG